MTYRFGVFEFDDSTLELRKSGRLVALEPQPARALARLLAHANETVSRDDLKLAVWGADTHVDFERGLAYCLSQIRAALGDKGDNPRFVQTLPRKGYCFVAPVHVAGAATEAVASRQDRTRIDRPRRAWIAGVVVVALLGTIGAWVVVRHVMTNQRVVIAVSVFDNETGMPQYDRLVAGMSDLVVARLTELAPTRLRVVGNAAVLRQPRNIRNLKAVAASLYADYVVLGQLQQEETGLRFITHFIRLSDQTHLKANRIPLPDGNVAGLETAVVAEFERVVNRYVLSN